jgi:hypothetical protein
VSRRPLASVILSARAVGSQQPHSRPLAGLDDAQEAADIASHPAVRATLAEFQQNLTLEWPKIVRQFAALHYPISALSFAVVLKGRELFQFHLGSRNIDPAVHACMHVCVCGGRGWGVGTFKFARKRLPSRSRRQRWSCRTATQSTRSAQ